MVGIFKVDSVVVAVAFAVACPIGGARVGIAVVL